MTGYEADDSHLAEDFSRTVPETPWFHEYHFSNHYSLPEQEHYENTRHSQQKYHLLHQNQVSEDLSRLSGSASLIYSLKGSVFT